MDIFDVLKKEKEIFVVDDIEDKKTKALITQINNQFSNIIERLENFESFAESQLSGAYNKKIVMAKSLQRSYSNWTAINNACNNLAKEEANEINSFNGVKEQLINNLKILLKDSQKMPVISAYDVFNGQYMLSKKDHSIIILGGHNVEVINTLIEDVNDKFVVEGNFNDVEAKDLSANYSNVEKNVEECRNAVDNLFSNKPNKEEKALGIIETMEKAGVDLVFFATYKKDMQEVGCTSKEIDLYEKELFKKYIPVKKQLKKLLKVEFIDICDLSHDEADFPTQEFKAIDDLDIFED